ncbi:MAG: glycoside hydrolase family 16 protein [Candidatus Omnitrophica bacterium]|nr:glycoside hydrolase family 16 protein [Candidatus Omnitrophota bacterium]
MKKIFNAGIIMLVFIPLFFMAASIFSFAEEKSKDWKLVWSEEFNYAGKPTAAKWNYDEGCDGWGNGEVQCYTRAKSENARVEDGKLIIEARHDGTGKQQYTSARLNTKGKGRWAYGRIEVSAKLPSGRGVWPGIRMFAEKWNYDKYGQNFWPENGEIEMMEAVGYDPGQIHATVHTYQHNSRKGDAKTGTIKIADAETKFHVYAMEWFPDHMDFFVDNNKYFTFLKQRNNWHFWPFDKKFYLIFNLAVGGSWGGKRGIDSTIFPQRFEIDYVRVYQ